MEGLNKIELENGEYLLVAQFDDILNKVPVLGYSDKFIEIPGILLFIKEEKANILTNILNAGTELIPVDAESFESMIKAIEAHKVENGIFSFTTKIVPTREIIISTKNIIENAVLVRVFGSSIMINDLIFTSNVAEFHGNGMFASRKVYLLSFDKMTELKLALDAKG